MTPEKTQPPKIKAPKLSDLFPGCFINLDKKTRCQVLSIGKKAINLFLTGREVKETGTKATKSFTNKVLGKRCNLCGSWFIFTHVDGRNATITIDENQQTEG